MVVLPLVDRLRETLEVDCNEIWTNGRTPNTLSIVRVRLHFMALSFRDVVSGLVCSVLSTGLGRSESRRMYSLTNRATLNGFAIGGSRSTRNRPN